MGVARPLHLFTTAGDQSIPPAKLRTGANPLCGTVRRDDHAPNHHPSQNSPRSRTSAISPTRAKKGKRIKAWDSRRSDGSLHATAGSSMWANLPQHNGFLSPPLKSYSRFSSTQLPASHSLCFSSKRGISARSFTVSSKSMAETSASEDPRIAGIASQIRVIPDFPKPGIMFQDITTLLLDPKAFKDAIDVFVERYRNRNISVVAGIEARGFIFGPPIALAIGAKFVPLRKPKKLPGEVISEEYSLEYGKDRIEMHVGAVHDGEHALIIDDLIATGGTLCAAVRLLERVGAEVVECACVIELPELKGRDKLGELPLFVLVKTAL